MKYITTALVVAIAITMSGAAAAQNQSQNATVEANPGLIGAGSPIYGLEVAYDNAAMNIGLKKAGSVALERAAEARTAVERNDTRAAQRAVRNLERVANRSQSSEDEEGITRAISIMEETIANAPNEQARQGMQNALENMRQAQDRRQEAANRSGPNRDRPSQSEQAGNSSDREDRADRQQGQQRPNETDSGDANRTGSGDRNTTRGR